MQPNFIYTSSGDMWEFGCLAVYMLKREMPFLECCDASLIVEMSKCIGRVTAEDRKAIEFADQRKFIFPNMRRESMGRVRQLLFRASSAENSTSSNYSKKSLSLIRTSGLRQQNS